MTSLLLSLPDIVESYKSWIKKNPQTASDYELTAKWLSYIVAGRIHNSHVLSELVYCLSNLLVLFNDRIIRRSIGEGDTAPEKIKLWLAVVEYSEVFCELSVRKLWGKTGRWLVIVAIQVFKCIARFLLIKRYHEAIIENPSVAQLDRSRLAKSNNSLDLSQSEASSSFTLKTSGRIIRKIESSPPLALRTWKPVQPEATTNVIVNGQLKEVIKKRQVLAEYIYISKPLAHLICTGLFGTDSWRPWMLSLVFDITSLNMYISTKQMSRHSLTRSQKLQLSKRMVLLVLYLIRSPVYEKYSKNRIDGFLNALSKNIPLARLICQPLLQYLPFWQGNYFHMWST